MNWNFYKDPEFLILTIALKRDNKLVAFAKERESLNGYSHARGMRVLSLCLPQLICHATSYRTHLHASLTHSVSHLFPLI